MNPILLAYAGSWLKGFFGFFKNHALTILVVCLSLTIIAGAAASLKGCLDQRAMDKAVATHAAVKSLKNENQSLHEQIETNEKQQAIEQEITVQVLESKENLQTKVQSSQEKRDVKISQIQKRHQQKMQKLKARVKDPKKTQQEQKLVEQEEAELISAAHITHLWDVYHAAIQPLSDKA